MSEARNGVDGDGAGGPESGLDPHLAAAIAELPREISPERDLWPGIANEVSRRRQRHRRTLLLAAATLLVALGALLTLASGRTGAGGTEPRLAEERAAAIVPAAIERTVYSASEATLDGVRRQLEAEIEAHKDRLPPETRALVFENLRTIDRALAEIEAALAESPGDADLARTAMSYRQRQIDLLRQANRVASRL